MIYVDKNRHLTLLSSCFLFVLYFDIILDAIFKDRWIEFHYVLNFPLSLLILTSKAKPCINSSYPSWGVLIGWRWDIFNVLFETGLFFQRWNEFWRSILDTGLMMVQRFSCVYTYQIYHLSLFLFMTHILIHFITGAP